MSHHVVVDGSNLATEGRAMPSLAQLNEAVTAFMDEHPDALITVVVDATFGHRIDKKEVAEFDEAVANNEVVAPPAGAIGRGDAFLLGIANKVGATVLSNDSFQEFHGTYGWLFDEGRLIGGKPVPHVGWVFVNRVPVRGPISRSAMKESKRKKEGGAPRATKRLGSADANKPMPVPKAPPPGATLPGSKPVPAPAPARGGSRPAAGEAAARTEAPSAPKGSEFVNDFPSFLSFLEHHPIGTSVNAIVESYSSHGAYVRLGDVMGYVPLRLMADPPPRSARELLKLGDAVTLVVDSFAPARRSIDLAMVSMATAVAPSAPEKPEKPVKATKATKATKASKATTKAAKAAAAAVTDEAAPAKPTRKRAAKAAPEAAAGAPDASAGAPVAPTDDLAAADVRAKPARRSRKAAVPETPAAEPATEPGTTDAPAPRPTKRGGRTPAAAAAVPDAPAEAAASAPAAPAKRAPRTRAAATPDATPDGEAQAAPRKRAARTAASKRAAADEAADEAVSDRARSRRAPRARAAAPEA